MIPIPEITDVEMAFSSTKHAPAYDSIPAEFKRGRTKWHDLFTQIFYKGSEGIKMKAKEGVDIKKAQRAIHAYMSSWGPKHEEKHDVCAYMFSEWFDDWKRDGEGFSEPGGPMVVDDANPTV